MTDPTLPAVPVPETPPTPWIVEPSAERVELHDNRAEVTFTVKNQQPTRERVMFEIVPGDSVAASWFTIDGERQRAVDANQSTQYKVTIVAPTGTPVASYWFQSRVYAADIAPEESSTLSNRVTFSVATPTTAPKKPFPWWIISVVLAVLAVLGVGGFLLTRDKGGPKEVPRVVGMTTADATAALDKAGFHKVKTVKVQSTDIAAGLALGTDPGAGTVVETDQEITLRVAIRLAAPTLVAPGDKTKFDATTTSVALAWNPVPDAARYRLTVVAPACSVSPPTSAPPPTTAPPPTPPTTPPPMSVPGGGAFDPRSVIFVKPDFRVLICGFRVSGLIETKKIPVEGTNLDLSVDSNGGAALVQWSVSALDDQGNEGPSSTVRQFSYVP